MERIFRILVASVLLMVLGGCNGRTTAVTPAIQIEGPALVMFYTDN